MTIHRIHHHRQLQDGENFDLDQEALRYVKSVLRMKKGDRFILFDGTGWACEATIKEVAKERVIAEAGKTLPSLSSGVCLTLMQSLPKADKMDFIVHKATELGACRIIPFQSSRSIPKLSPEKMQLKKKRWQNVADQAARQCGRADIPQLKDVMSFEEALSFPGDGTLKLIFWEEETGKGIRQVMSDVHYSGLKDIAVVVGPEGGFAQEEVAKAVENGFMSVSLGRQVLKVDTAVVAILTIIQYERGMFGANEGGKHP